MNAIDIMEQAQNGKQIVPQFETPNGYSLFNQAQNKSIPYYKDFYQNKGQWYEKTGPATSSYELHGADGNKYTQSDGWEIVKNSDLPTWAEKKSQNMTMLYNALEALKNRQFQEKMYGERYQKIIQDIKKAGLNPYAINFFSPGGFGSGSAASIMSNYQAGQSTVRSSSRVKSKSENTNRNFGDIGTAGIIGAMNAVGLVVAGLIKSMVATPKNRYGY